MPRYHNEFRFTGDVQPLFDQINQYLMQEGYEYVNFEGEMVYKKGKGFATGPTFLKMFVDNETFVLEAWLKFAALPGVYAGEMGLDGAMGFAMKAVLRTRVEYVESLIAYHGGVPMMYAGTQPYPQQPQQQQPQQLPYGQPQQPPYGQPQYNYNQPPQQVYQQSYQQPYQQPYGQPTPQHSPMPNGAPAFCSQCGSPVAPGSKFCNNCGAKIQ